MLNNITIFKKISLFIFPYIILYGLYIQVNGEVSPGGGFQAGVIFASSLIIFDLIFGKDKLKEFFPINLLVFMAIFGVLIYASIGLISLIYNDNYLNYYSIMSDKHLAQSLGITFIEIGVGLTVAATMSMIYILFQK